LEYSEKMLYNQLLFLSRCFDVEKVKATGQGQAGQAKEKTEEKERVGVLAEMNRKSFGVLRAVVEAYLDKSGWGWVSMDGLFGFALKALQG
jgi:DNA polymerase alpha subunit A